MHNRRKIKILGDAGTTYVFSMGSTIVSIAFTHNTVRASWIVITAFSFSTADREQD